MKLMGKNTGMVWDAFPGTQTSIEKKSNVFFPVGCTHLPRKRELCDKQFAKSGGAVLRLRVRVFRSFTDTRPAKSSRAGSRRIWRGGES